MIDYNEAIKVGIEAYIAKKGMDETFLRNEVIPCLKEMVKEKAIAGDIDQQFIKLSEAVIVLEGNYSEDTLETVITEEDLETADLLS